MTTASNDPTGDRAAHPGFRVWGLRFGIAAWMLVVATSMISLVAYSQREGSQGTPQPAHETGLNLPAEGYTLVMAVHPHCPCTRASVYELERLLVRCQGKLHSRFLIYAPEGAEEGWAGEDPLAIKARFPDTYIQIDPGGRTAADLGCEVSGAVVLFDPEGKPQFWGGITPSRGHAGNNIGSDAIASIVLGSDKSPEPTPVFGCPLANRVDKPTTKPCCEGENP